MRKHIKNYFIPNLNNEYSPLSVSLRSLIILVILALLVFLMAFFGSNTIPKYNLLADVQEAYLVLLTNEDRAVNKIDSLVQNPILEKAAKLKIEDMINNQYFAHTSPDGKNSWYWFDKVNYKYQYAGENLAIDFYDTKKVSKAWMDSPTHRKNILNSKYTEIGVAVGSGKYEGRTVSFVVQMFGTPRVMVPENSRDSIFAHNDFKEINKVNITNNKSEVLGNEIFIGTEKNNLVIIEPAPELLVTDNKNLFTETTFEDEQTVPINIEKATNEDLPVKNIEEINNPTKLVMLLMRPVLIGKIAIISLISILGFALVFRLFIEYKKHHYTHVIYILLTMFTLFMIYLAFTYYFSRVIIV